MEFKVRFRPQNTPDYPELVMTVGIDDSILQVMSSTGTIDKERQVMEAAAKIIREHLVNHDVISIERIY